MAYQFLHIETYSIKPTKVTGTRTQYNSVAQIFGELLRDPTHSKHLDQPSPPLLILQFGATSPSELRELHNRLVQDVIETVHGKTGKDYTRGLKSDAKTLYTEIHSHPMTAQEYSVADQPTRVDVHQWAKRAILNFKNRMPPVSRSAPRST